MAVRQSGRSQFCIVVDVFGGAAVLYIPKREGRARAGAGGSGIIIINNMASSRPTAAAKNETNEL